MNIKKLTDREHVLKRPEMYIGSVREIEEERTVFINNEIHFNKKIKYIPGLIKIIEEIIDNSVDEAIRTKFNFANKIKITMTTEKVIVEDNGRGIPIETNEDGEYYPFVAWNYLKAGSNFEDKNRTTLGIHGIGSSVSNILSKKFIGETWNNNKHYKCIWKNNASEFKENIKEIDKDKTGTKVTLYPDFSLFEGRDKFEEIDFLIIKSRLTKLALVYPEITFIFNKEKIKVKDISKQFLFSEGDIKKNNYQILFAKSSDAEFEEMSIINGLDIKSGSHITYILNKIIPELQKKIKKKYKVDVKPIDIKNNLRIAVLIRFFENLRFTSQSKEYISNSSKEISKVFDNVKWEKIVTQLMKSDEIINSIVEFYRLKEELKATKEVKKRIKIVDENYISSIKEKEYLFLTEGLSAMNGLRNIFGRKNFGYLAMTGVPMNIWEKPLSKIVATKKFKLISQLCGVDYSKKIGNPIYDKIVIATDMDVFGIHIRGLLLAYFYKFAKNLFDTGKIYILKTPLVFVFKNNKLVKYFFNLDDLKEFENNTTEKYIFKYAKGLGSLEQDIMKSLIKDKGIDYFLEKVELNDIDKKELDVWFSQKQADERKEIIKQYQFNIQYM